MGDRTEDELKFNWPLGVLTTLPFAFRVHGEGTAPSGSVIAGLPVPHPKSLGPTLKTGTPVAHLKPAPGMFNWADLTACGFAEAGMANTVLLYSENPVGMELRPAPKPAAIKSSTWGVS